MALKIFLISLVLFVSSFMVVRYWGTILFPDTENSHAIQGLVVSASALTAIISLIVYIVNM